MNSRTKVDRGILFSQCEFFIDYCSTQTGCDRSLRLGNELQTKYGAKIVEIPNVSSTTHIIFKNGNFQTKLFAKKYNLPLIDPFWLEQCINKRRLVRYNKYLVDIDDLENQQQLTEDLEFERLNINNKELIGLSTPKIKTGQLTDNNVDSGKRMRKALYTPVHGQFDQGNPDEYFDHQNRQITLDNLGMNLPDDNHQLIHRYGCSVARRQVQDKSQLEIKDEPLEKVKSEELPTTLSIPSQSQTSPIIHFANTIRHGPISAEQIPPSPSTTFDFDSQQQYIALGIRPQSTPILHPITDDNHQIQEIPIENDLHRISPLKTIDYSSFTKITPLKTKATNRLETCPEKDDIIIENVEIPINNDQIIPRPPPLLALSQAIRRKYPEQIAQTKFDDQFPSIKDLPNAPANYSFVFYGFSSTQLEEAKRLTRRMGDCFSLDNIDISTTHVILPNDDPQLKTTLELFLALIYGCRFVTFEWLKSSARIGEWLNVNKFETKNFFLNNPSLNIYRKSRQQQKPIHLFNESGRIYLTSLAKQRSLLLKLITLLGGNVTVNRNSAQIVVGHSSKPLPIMIYPQVTEQWVFDSIQSGGCLPPDDYLIENNAN